MRLYARPPLAPLLILALAACLAGSLAGCADLNIPNPFSPTTDVRDVYFSEFSDVPIPADMKSVPRNTLVTPSGSGAKTGLETFSGRVEASSLASAMLHNMSNQGWTLRGTASGKRTVQVFEKDQRVAVISITSQTLDTAMEVWMMGEMVSGGTTNLSLSPGVSPATTGNGGASGAATATEQWEGGVSSRPLSQ